MYLHFYCLIDVLVNIFVKSVAEQTIYSDACLDRTLSFVSDYDYYTGTCGFFDGSSVQIDRRGTATCQTRCQITLDYNKGYWDKLAVVSFLFDGYNYSTRTHCSTANRAHLFIDCSNLRKKQLDISWTEDCKERYAECSNWNNFCVCHCDPGYFMINGHCLQENLHLNESCMINDQCSGSSHAICLNGICACDEGYIASTSFDCELAHQIDNQAVTQTETTKNNAILGAFFGGLILGTIITTALVFILYRRFCSKIQKRTDPQLLYTKNETYNRTNDKDIIQQDKQRQVLNVSPLTRSEQSPEYRNTSGQQSAMTLTDDVYNHLNEEEETQDGDTYDHACAATKKVQLIELGDYSNHQGLRDDYNLSAGTATDDYFTLEHI